jgi:transposase
VSWPCLASKKSPAHEPATVREAMAWADCSGRQQAGLGAAVTSWLDARGQRWKDQVQALAMDPCAACRSAVQRALPHAQIVVTTSTWSAWANQAVTRVRQRVTRQRLDRRGTAGRAGQSWRAGPGALGTVSGRVALSPAARAESAPPSATTWRMEAAEVAAGYWRHHEPAEKFMASVTAEYPGRRITVHHRNIGDADDGTEGVVVDNQMEPTDQREDIDVLAHIHLRKEQVNLEHALQAISDWVGSGSGEGANFLVTRLTGPVGEGSLFGGADISRFTPAGSRGTLHSQGGIAYHLDFSSGSHVNFVTG